MDLATLLIVFGILGLLFCAAAFTGAFVGFAKRIAETAEKYVADAASFKKAVLVQDDSGCRGSKSDPLLVSVSAGDCEGCCECGACGSDCDDPDEDDDDLELDDSSECYYSDIRTCHCEATGDRPCEAWCEAWADIDSAIGLGFLRLRCDAGLPYDELAVLAGLGAEWGAKILEQFEDGETPLPLPVLRDVLRVMGATLDDLMVAAESTGEGRGKESEGEGDE